MLLLKLSLFIAISGLAKSADLEYQENEVRALSDEEMRMSEEAGYSYVDRLSQLEDELYAQGHYVKSDSPFYSMAQFKRANPEARELGQKALRMLEATRFLKNELRLSRDDSGLRLSASSFSVINNTCLATTVCSTTSKYYRNINGTCNSLTNTNLGSANTDYRRLLAPAYSDGIQIPRLATNGSALPSARLVSVVAFGGADVPLNSTTLALMQFAQFINHDMELTPQFTYSNGTDITCCTSSGGSISSALLYPACLPISIPTNDKFFNQPVFVRDCMNFVRSIAGPRLDCSLGYADQINSNTHWLDASTVYGSTNSVMSTLRQFTGGLLKMTNDTVNKRQLLPISSTCTNKACFVCGDSRCTEQPQLTVMHTLWAREHNRIANSLSALNPTWNDETIFQEARRIVVAEVQHITYNEFIPNLISSTSATKYSLNPLTTGFVTNYTTVSTGPVSNEFAAAAFRMGHSLVQGLVKLYDENGGLLSTSYNMSNTFNDASMIVNQAAYLDAVIRGLLIQPSQSVDNFVVDDLWNSLFKNVSVRGRNFGFDIVALNIQRGRDHGLPSYNTYRQLCGFSKLTSFADLTNRNPAIQPRIPPRVVAFLSSVYASVDDIDLYVGGLSEVSDTAGGVVGPTFSCIIGEHFSKLKYSDRFFYEMGNQLNSFTSAQLTELRKASLARIFCDNSDGTVLSVQAKAFAAVSGTNARVKCTTIPSLNLSVWKGTPLNG